LKISRALTPVRMRKLRALVLDEFVDNVLAILQADECIHVLDVKRALSRWEDLPQPYTTGQEIRTWQSISNDIERIHSSLGLKRELGLLEQLFKPRERAPIEIGSKEEMELVNSAEDIVAILEKEIEEKIKKYQGVRELLWEMRAAKIDIENFRATERVYIKLGKIARDEIPQLENELKSRTGYTSVYAGGKQRIRFVAVISLSRFSEEIETTLSKHGFQETPIAKELSGDPNNCLRFIDAQLSNILKKHERQILCLYDAVSAKIERLKTEEKLGKMERVFILEGWVPEEKGEHVKALIKKAAEGHATVVISPADEPELEIPTLLKNRKVIGSFRMLTEMYGMPVYNEIDPTPFLAIFFTFLVGLMSADLAIGTTVIISSVFIRRGAGSRSKNMRSLSVILFCTGISTIFFGILTGEFMGGIVKLPILWISVVDNPIEFLLIVIGIGMAHLVFGAILGFFNDFYSREFRKIIGDHLSTILMIGSATIFLTTGNFGFQGLSIVGYTMGIAGLVALIIGKGAIGMLELTRLLSNVVSYVRILAINMATAWMSRTFVLLGTLIVDIYIVGIILNGIILLFSHLFIVFISVFATFAHALRLHYVEFFGRFFKGGGIKFSPLTSEREFTVLKTPIEKTEGGN
jgi:V/A-type H+-transporting ATPase subunit I